MKKTILVSFLVILNAFTAAGQQTNDWKFVIEPYLMLPSMNGTSSLSDLPEIEVNASVDDVFDNLKFGAMLYAEANNGTWAFSSDFLYMNLSQSGERNRIIQEATVQAKQLGWELAGLRHINPWFDAGIGFRLNSITLSHETVFVVNELIRERSAERTNTWLDPVIITRFHNPEGKDFIYQVRADIGGFGIGSDLTWQLQAYAGYQVSSVFHITLGYRIISMDYSDGSGQDQFLYDINTSGLNVRFGFTIY